MGPQRSWERPRAYSGIVQGMPPNALKQLIMEAEERTASHKGGSTEARETRSDLAGRAIGLGC